MRPSYTPADTGAGRPISSDEVDGDLAQQSEVAGGHAVAHATVVLAEDDV